MPTARPCPGGGRVGRPGHRGRGVASTWLPQAGCAQLCQEALRQLEAEVRSAPAS